MVRQRDELFEAEGICEGEATWSALKVLFENPDKMFHEDDMDEFLDCNTGTVIRSLQELVSMGFANVTPDHHYCYVEGSINSRLRDSLNDEDVDGLFTEDADDYV